MHAAPTQVSRDWDKAHCHVLGRMRWDYGRLAQGVGE